MKDYNTSPEFDKLVGRHGYDRACSIIGDLLKPAVSPDTANRAAAGTGLPGHIVCKEYPDGLAFYTREVGGGLIGILHPQISRATTPITATDLRAIADHIESRGGGHD